MKIDRKTIIKPQSPSDYDNNLESLAEGVKFIACTFVANLAPGAKWQPSTPACNELLPGERFSCIEVYANGAVNLFVRNLNEELVAVVRIRQDE